MDGFVITDTTLVDADTMRDASLRVAGARIAEVLPARLRRGDLADLCARHQLAVVDGHDRWVIPGGVDPHVHFALPAGDTVTIDDFASGTRAALAGGTTTVVDFVTPAREEPLVAATEARLAIAADAACDYHLHLSATAWRPGLADELIACAARFGTRSVKVYLAYLDTIGLAADVLPAVLRACASANLTVLVHAEDGAEIARRQRELLVAGQSGVASHARARPPATEARAIARVLAAAATAGCRLYVVHVSTGDGIAAIGSSRAAGQVVYAETCPQYLLLDECVYEGPFDVAAPFVMSPPLRGAADRAALAGAVADGQFDVVATDHCAFTHAQKARGRDDFTRIPGGVAGVEHRLALAYTALVATNCLAATDWVHLVSRRPAEIFGLHPRKGSLEPAADADLVLWDPSFAGTIRASESHSRCDHSIYEGMAIRGRPERVWSRGEEVVRNGSVSATTGRGRYLGA